MGQRSRNYPHDLNRGLIFTTMFVVVDSTIKTERNTSKESWNILAGWIVCCIGITKVTVVKFDLEAFCTILIGRSTLIPKEKHEVRPSIP